MTRSILFICLFSAASVAAYDNSTWYTRYPAYPEYCSIPEQMDRRAIPPLKEDYRLGETRLVHVTSVIRHGARTPTSAHQDCWEGFWQDASTAIWDCDLTTFLAPPLEATGDGNVMFLFEKLYDALQPPLKNRLNGTCQVGQLLLRGFQQEMHNGQHLRAAYVYDSHNMDHDPRMRLLDISGDQPPFALLRYRSDDDQRTVMSGQVLLRGLFGEDFLKHVEQHGIHAVISVHTADRPVDVLTSNEADCPRLTELYQEALDSKEYKSFVNSKEVKLLERFMKKELGQIMDDEPIDCIMTTICTDRPLPEALDDFGRTQNATKYHKEYGENLLDRVYTSAVTEYGIPQQYNDGAYVKLGMGPLWAEIMSNIRPILNNTTPPPNRLALFSGHDTTVMPLLMTLGVWDGTWAPYATMMIIEIHEIIDGQTDRTIFKSDFCFRLLLNGQMLTEKIDGCPKTSDLCDVQVLLDHVAPFATANRDCEPRASKEHPALQESKALLSTGGGVALVLAVVVLSGLLGSLITFYAMTRRLPCQKRYELGLAITPLEDGSPPRYRDDDDAQRNTVTTLVD